MRWSSVFVRCSRSARRDLSQRSHVTNISSQHVTKLPRCPFAHGGAHSNRSSHGATVRQHRRFSQSKHIQELVRAEIIRVPRPRTSLMDLGSYRTLQMRFLEDDSLHCVSKYVQATPRTQNVSIPEVIDARSLRTIPASENG